MNAVDKVNAEHFTAALRDLATFVLTQAHMSGLDTYATTWDVIEDGLLKITVMYDAEAPDEVVIAITGLQRQEFTFPRQDLGAWTTCDAPCVLAALAEVKRASGWE